MRRRSTKTRKHKRRQSRRRRSHKRRGGALIFNVKFIQPDGNEIQVDGNPLTKEQTLTKPKLEFVDDDRRAFVVVMYDEDAPSPAMLHWLSLIHRRTFDRWTYEPPNPPAGEVHTYTIELLSKPYDGRGVIGILEEVPGSRHNFDIDKFKRDNGLMLEAKIIFTCG